MKIVGAGHIDYMQGIYATRQGLKSRFGVRVRESQCWALVQIGDDEASTFGKPHKIPVDLSTLPSYLQMIVQDHELNYPDSDLIDVLIGTKSIRETLGLPEKIGIKQYAGKNASDGQNECNVKVAGFSGFSTQPTLRSRSSRLSTRT
jgi:hypothetical protein